MLNLKNQMKIIKNKKIFFQTIKKISLHGELKIKEQFETIIIGGGVVGLAIANKLAKKNGDTLLIEKNKKFGEKISKRNSAVIHSGIYYPPKTLKSKLCIIGRKKLFSFCKKNKISHKQIGKLIVANSKSEFKKLIFIKKNAELNIFFKKNKLRLFDKIQTKKLEPKINCYGSIYSPGTGILDTKQYIKKLEENLKKKGRIFYTEMEVKFIIKTLNGFQIITKKRGKEKIITCKKLINSAGLNAHKIAKSFKGFPKKLIPNIFFAKGSYFLYSKKLPFKKLIYPLPNKNSLGIHSNIDINGNFFFGPDIEKIKKIEFKVDVKKKKFFYNSIKKFYPKINLENFKSGFAGIRPKLDYNKNMDFLIQDSKIHSLDNYINLFGIESPGLTSSLAIADLIDKILSK